MKQIKQHNKHDKTIQTIEQIIERNLKGMEQINTNEKQNKQSI